MMPRGSSRRVPSGNGGRRAQSSLPFPSAHVLFGPSPSATASLGGRPVGAEGRGLAEVSRGLPLPFAASNRWPPGRVQALISHHEAETPHAVSVALVPSRCNSAIRRCPTPAASRRFAQLHRRSAEFLNEGSKLLARLRRRTFARCGLRAAVVP